MSPARASCLAIALVALALGGCADRPEVAKRKHLERAEQYLRGGKVNEAVIELRNALRIDDKFVPALHALGRAYAEKSWYGDAIRELGRAQRLAPAQLDLARDLGRALIEVGAWKDAETQAQRILGVKPDDPDGLYVHAAALAVDGKGEEALRVLDARQGAPFSPDADAVRAEVYLRLGQIDRAEQAYRGILEKAPGHARSLAGLGGISLARQHHDEALRLFQQAKLSRPRDARVRLGLAAALARAGQVPEAIKELEGVDPRARFGGLVMALALLYIHENRPSEAVQLLTPAVSQLPDVFQARFLLATAYLASHSPEEAVREFEELNRRQPDDSTIQLRLAMAYARRGRARDALALLDRLAKALDKSPEYHLERARTLVLLGRLDEAFRAASTAQRLAPQAPQPYVVMGQIRAHEGNAQGARELLARAVELDTSHAPAHLALGRLSLAQKDPETALREFDAAIRASPRALTPVHMKATVLVQQQRVGEAVELVEAALRSDPRKPGLHSLLGALHLRQGQSDKAAAAYRRALELDRRSVEARLGLTRLAFAARRDDEAIEQLRAILAQLPDQATAVPLLVSIYSRLGRPDQAVPVLEAAVRANPHETSYPLLLGEFYLRIGRYEAALEGMAAALHRTPELVGARLIRAQAFIARGDGAAALKELDAALKVNPRQALAHYYRAHAQVGLGRLAEAHAAYQEALRLSPQLQSARVELAALAGPGGGEDTGRHEVERQLEAIKQEPRNVPLRESLVRSLLLQRRAKEAQAALRQILELAPTHVGANFLLARLLLDEGKAAEALPHLQAVVRTNPEHIEANLALADHALRRGLEPEAMEHLHAAVRADPNLLEAQLKLGELYLRARRLDQALTLARDLEKRMPASPAPPLLRGKVLHAQGNPGAAAEAYAAALRLRPDLGEAHRRMGQAWEDQGQPDRAQEQYRKALALDGNDVLALNNLAWLLAEVKKSPEQGLPLALKARQLAPQSLAVMDTLGWIHYRRGAYDEAERLLAQAVERAPQSGAIHYHLGMTYLKKGRKGDALYALRRAAQLDPKLAEAERLGELLAQLGG